MKFDLEAVYWTLSTTAETLVALVGFLGLLAVWRLETLTLPREESHKFLVKLRDQKGVKCRTESPFLIAMASGLLATPDRLNEAEAFDATFHKNQLERSINSRLDILEGLWHLTVFGLSSIAGCLISLALTPLLVVRQELAIMVLGTLLLLTVWTLVTSGRLLIHSLTGPDR